MSVVGYLDAGAGSQRAILLQGLGRTQQLYCHHTARQIDRLLGLEHAGGSTLDGFAAIMTGGADQPLLHALN